MDQRSCLNYQKSCGEIATIYQWFEYMIGSLMPTVGNLDIANKKTIVNRDYEAKNEKHWNRISVVLMKNSLKESIKNNEEIEIAGHGYAHFVSNIGRSWKHMAHTRYRGSVPID